MSEDRGVDALDVLRVEIRHFAEERDWQSFHSPKDLAIGISIEAAELLAVFEWRTAGDVEAPASMGTTWQAAREMADIMIRLVRLADILGVDLVTAARDKLRLDAQRYPVDRAHGTSVPPPRP
jgi:NTP pyrophosphatase (non-canonical NTP hydrolase)